MDTFDKLKQISRQRKELNQQEFEETSKDRLFAIIKKKLETTFIGDIAAIESAFGELWGIEFKDTELTQEEEKMKLIWSTLRNNILDRGNAQIRAIKNELEQHTIRCNGYNYKLEIKERGNKNERI